MVADFSDAVWNSIDMIIEFMVLKNHPHKHNSEIPNEPISGHGTDNGNLM